MNNPIPQCATDSPEWAFRAVEMINGLLALREAVEWWIDCSEGHDENGWGFWIEDDASEELAATCNVAWAAVLHTMEATR